MMKHGLVFAITAPALLALGAAANRSWSGSAGSIPRKASEAAETPALPNPTPRPVVRTKPEADLALSVIHAFVEVEAARDGRWGRLDATGTELIDSREREAKTQAAHLTEMLQVDPGAWDDVIDLLITVDATEAAVRAGRLLQDAVDTAAERRLMEILRVGLSTAKRVALALLGRRGSDEMLSAILAALDDPDPRLRFDVLTLLAERRARPDSPTATAVVEAALRRQVQTDPDRNLQNVARAVLGEPGRMSVTPARRSPRPLGSIGSRLTNVSPSRPVR
jgi:hypothetical protein